MKFNLNFLISLRVTIVINERVIADHMAKLKQQKRVPIDEEALRWTPLVQSGMFKSLCTLFSLFPIYSSNR